MSRIALVVLKEVALAAVFAGTAAVITAFAQRHAAEAANGFTGTKPDGDNQPA